MAIFGNNSDQPRQGFGCSGRLIIAIVIGLGSLGSWYFTRQENPVTHEVQHVAISPEQEIALGLNSAPEMAREMGGVVPESDPQAKLVSSVGNYIVEHSDAHNGPWQYAFHLLADSKTVNAFALPGGQVFMTKGLLDKLSNEAEVAGVLGHECGHVIERHSAQQMAKAQRDNMLVVATGIGASDDRGHGGQAQAIAAVVAQMSQLRYSRGDESDADQWGLKLMSEAGYDPHGMERVMKVLENESRGDHQPEFLETHPNPEHRLDKIDAWIAKQFPNGVPGTLSDTHHLNDSARLTGAGVEK